MLTLLLFALTASGDAAVADRQTVPYSSFRISETETSRIESPDYRQCMDNSGGITINMRNCSAAEMERLDKRLNTAYRAALQRQTTRGRSQLRASQRQWLKHRWDICHARPRDGGTIDLLLDDSCGIEQMVRRIAWLERAAR